MLYDDGTWRTRTLRQQQADVRSGRVVATFKDRQRAAKAGFALDRGLGGNVWSEPGPDLADLGKRIGLREKLNSLFGRKTGFGQDDYRQLRKDFERGKPQSKTGQGTIRSRLARLKKRIKDEEDKAPFPPGADKIFYGQKQLVKNKKRNKRSPDSSIMTIYLDPAKFGYKLPKAEAFASDCQDQTSFKGAGWDVFEVRDASFAPRKPPSAMIEVTRNRAVTKYHYKPNATGEWSST